MSDRASAVVASTLAIAMTACGLAGARAQDAPSNESRESVAKLESLPLSVSDRRADLHARHHMRDAMSELSADGRRAALDRLERAEGALLNRHVYDLGPSLKTDQPVPKTSLISDLDEARLAVLRQDAARARQIAARVAGRLDAELARAPAR